MRLFYCFAVFSSIVFADSVVMKNGDKLTGEILTTTEKGVVFKSEFAGEVTIGWDNISEVSSPNPVIVTTKDGRKITGTTRTTDGRVVITPQGGEPVEVPKETVAAVRNAVGQQTFEQLEFRKLHPGFLDLYTGFFDFGVAGARGNSKTQNYASTAKMNRVTDKDNFGIYFNQIYTSNSTLGPKEVTAQAMRGGWNYARNLGPKWFLQGFNDYEYDRFQGLDLRVVVGGGLGYYFIKNDRGFLSVSGGASWNREQFGVYPPTYPEGLLRNSAEVYVAQEWVYKLNRIFSVQEKFVIFPNMSDLGSYRINFDTSLAAAVNRIFALQFTVSDRYLANPLQGRLKNDVLFSAGIRATIPTREKGK